MRYSVPSENPGNRVENKSSIGGAEVERAAHHGLRNVKNAVTQRLGLGPRAWQALQFTTEQGSSWNPTPGLISHFFAISKKLQRLFLLPVLVKGKGVKSVEVR